MESTSNTGEHKHEERINHPNNNQEFKTETKMNTKWNHTFKTTPTEKRHEQQSRTSQDEEYRQEQNKFNHTEQE